MSHHYRRVSTTRQAIGLISRYLERVDCARVRWYLDRPVSNSGRLKRLIEDVVAESRPAWEVELTSHTDRRLKASVDVVATADSAILDSCQRWFNLARNVVSDSIESAWLLDLGSGSDLG